ncbi:MAG: Bifunctional purine biosynthesis protein PurH [Acidimicrobiales bacterium]|nr:MAG: bifunctional phosphoribosylaminoimidazolecarboxamide formyltransferase/IMP cyclohydrolase PurH [Actinomycetota bacterium]MBV6507967.1 Bifunctional purine biosynthesis protein PurH [Acidimicrobiales bacterium]RIK06940.1 MAG: bifunctional phosphoribosylaminoimidazolecarboxamide formyltransferase/IMP cyclohydrolase PurH [Acidobacteriota bacterium]
MADAERGGRRALVSVYDKAGLTDLAKGLVDLGFEIVSSGGTAAALREAGLAVTDVEALTGAPEMLGGRVKTLHPAIHGGILADLSNPQHLADLTQRGIAPIDLVVCNLYPFTSEPSIEMIDIGGPTMVRAAAKNHAHVGVVVDPSSYRDVLDELGERGALSGETRRRLARAAFAHTAAYDAAIVSWFDDNGEDPLPPTLHLSVSQAQSLRYGENPHQFGARYRTATGGCWDEAVQYGGKEMSYLNVYDTDAAWRLVHSLGVGPAVAIVKHANPCGVAVSEAITDAYRKAHECDPVSAFGGIVAVNRPVPPELAEALAPVFTEVVIAPAYDDDALETLSAKKNLRVLAAPPPTPPDLEVRTVDGGLLVQTRDVVSIERSKWRVVTEAEPTARQWNDLELAWRVAARTTSNCIVMVNDGQAVGIGAGQQNRRDAGRIAAEKAAGRAQGGACASDAFFPFRDGLDAAAEAGCATVIQPGGSIRDEEVIEAANEHGMAMVFTGERHFRH